MGENIRSLIVFQSTVQQLSYLQIMDFAEGVLIFKIPNPLKIRNLFTFDRFLLLVYNKTMESIAIIQQIKFMSALDIKFSKKQLEQIKKIGIETIYLFGSQAKGTANILSDVDAGIVLSEPEKYRNNTMDAYLKLYDIFTDILPKEYLRRRFKMRKHEIDIVFLQFAPISLQFNAIRGAKILYEKDEKKRFEYEEYVLKRYLDLNYLYNLSFKCLLERI